MHTKVVELTNGFNWGKFLVCRFDSEWQRRSALPEENFGTPLLARCGWGPEHVGVFDLATGEGAFYRPGGNARADLEKHAIWVCPMYESFLTWLYKHPEGWQNLDALPDVVTLIDDQTRGKSALCGHRRPGPTADERFVKGLVHEVLALQGGWTSDTSEGLEALLRRALNVAPASSSAAIDSETNTQ